MKSEVLSLLKRKSGESVSLRQLRSQLSLPKHRQKELKDALFELTHEGKILIDKDLAYSYRDENRVLKGKIKIHSEGFGFFIPDSKKKADVFIPSRNMNFAMNGDEVLVESSKNSRDGRFEGRIIQVLKRAQEVVVGTLEALGKDHVVRFKDAKHGLEEIYIPKKNLSQAKVGDLVAVKILQYPGPRIEAIGEVQTVIGEEFDERSMVEAALIQNGIYRPFPDAVNRDVSNMPAEVSSRCPSDRVDLRDLPIMTIDGVTAKDFDDAVCVLKRGRSYILYVSIADVSEYVKDGSPLDEEAYNRATSVYLPNECIPMLPEKLSNGLCSLNPHVPRYTMTAEIHYNENADFVKASYYKSLICSHKRATYREVEAYFDGSDDEDFSPEILKSLDNMKELADALIAKAKARGAMGFDLPEPEVVFDAHGKMVNIVKRKRFFSHKLIEQFMVAANVAVAQYFSVNDLPIVYRVHDKPDMVKLETFVNFAKNLGFAKQTKEFYAPDFFDAIHGHALESFLHSVFLRSLKQAQYMPDNLGHFGLGLDDYAHFTSPIRRYPDLIVHRQLKALVDASPNKRLELTRQDLRHKKKGNKENLVYSFSDLVEMGEHCSSREREAIDAERGVTDLQRAFFIKEYIGEKFYGLISKINKYGLVIELDPYFVNGFLPIKGMHDDFYIFDEKKIRLVGRRTRQSFKIGQRVWVQVESVDVETGDIRLRREDDSVPDSPRKDKRKKRRQQRKKGGVKSNGKRKGNPKPVKKGRRRSAKK